MEHMDNQIRLRGSLMALPHFSHENHGKKFYRFTLEVPRLSGAVDLLPVVAEEAVLNTLDLSGGEMQKLVLARAIYKNGSILILDEPTAALDPIAEAEIYSKFDEIVGDKTAIYISHRLSSCRFCDKIAVFDEGRIVQVGTHEELLTNTEGKYYELWNAQASYYA